MLPLYKDTQSACGLTSTVYKHCTCAACPDRHLHVLANNLSMHAKATHIIQESVDAQTTVSRVTLEICLPLHNQQPFESAQLQPVHLLHQIWLTLQPRHDSLLA